MKVSVKLFGLMHLEVDVKVIYTDDMPTPTTEQPVFNFNIIKGVTA